MSTNKKAVRKPIRASEAMKKFMADYYLELDHATQTGERRIAWCTSVGPAEILRAFGFLVYFPETHAAMLGSTRTATDHIPFATALGYAPEICSYLTADIGAFRQGFTPLTKAYGIKAVPQPAALVFNTNQCRDVQDWFGWYAAEFNVPLLGVYTHRGHTDVATHQLQSITHQLEDLIAPLAQIAGRRFDLDEFRRVVALSRECSDLWRRVLETAAAAPAPLTFFDSVTLMGPAVVGRGTQAAVDFYKLLLAELQERTARGEGAIEVERFRLYWEGMPIWGRLRAHSELFADLGASVLASTYCNSWIFSALDPDEPFASLARAYSELFITRSDVAKEAQLKKMLAFFGIDGIIYHNARTCPNNSNSRYGLPQRLAAATGVPSLTIDGDLNDLRCLSDEQTNTNIEAFIEQLAENR
ncbi:MAG: 2-hydroxyacyl-CoA dehydratase [Acidobacteria bacterium]|nr:2-hydroxyacyl-CoA dehydratase [Acidobacteriota bacterium]